MQNQHINQHLPFHLLGQEHQHPVALALPVNKEREKIKIIPKVHQMSWRMKTHYQEKYAHVDGIHFKAIWDTRANIPERLKAL